MSYTVTEMEKKKNKKQQLKKTEFEHNLFSLIPQ